MDADGYAGFEDIYRSGDIREVACMTMPGASSSMCTRRRAPPSQTRPLGGSPSFTRSRKCAGLAPDKRVEIRLAEAKHVFQSLEIWLNRQLPYIYRKSHQTNAIRHALIRMTRIRPYLNHGILEIDNNTVERPMRAVALGFKNCLLVGSQTGGKSATIAYTLIETAKPNGVDPQA